MKQQTKDRIELSFAVGSAAGLLMLVATNSTKKTLISFAIAAVSTLAIMSGLKLGSNEINETA